MGLPISLYTAHAYAELVAEPKSHRGRTKRLRHCGCSTICWIFLNVYHVRNSENVIGVKQHVHSKTNLWLFLYLFIYFVFFRGGVGLQLFPFLRCFFGFHNKQPTLDFNQIVIVSWDFDVLASTPNTSSLTWLPPAWSNICQRYQRSFLVVLLARIVVTMEYSSGSPFGNISLQRKMWKKIGVRFSESANAKVVVAALKWRISALSVSAPSWMPTIPELWVAEQWTSQHSWLIKRFSISSPPSRAR